MYALLSLREWNFEVGGHKLGRGLKPGLGGGGLGRSLSTLGARESGKANENTWTAFGDDYMRRYRDWSRRGGWSNKLVPLWRAMADESRMSSGDERSALAWSAFSVNCAVQIFDAQPGLPAAQWLRKLN